ncbi:MAG: CoA transferase [Proteobacteria bacterium]|nr:CoA transferase [Pseudomonadota bacterium]
MDGLLKGIRILDLTQMLAGPFGTLLLADMGAEVIKIENPGGDRTRMGGQAPFENMGTYFLSINRNKKSVVIDLKNPKGLELFYEMVRKADVVVDNMRPKALDDLKVDFDNLKKHNPKIVSCSLSGYGHTGPYKDLPSFDLIAQAMSGGMSITGEADGPPIRAGIAVGDLSGGMFSALGILAALQKRDRTGEGQKIDVGLLDCLVSMTTYLTAYYFKDGMIPGPQGSRHAVIVPYEAYKAEDLWLVIAAVVPKQWESLCRALEREDLMVDERFVDHGKRLENRDVLFDILQEIFSQKPVDEWIEILQKADVPCSPVNTLDRVLNDPQVLERNMVVDLEHPEKGKISLAGNPIKAPGTDEFLNFPPDLGQHTAEVLKDLLGYSDEKVGQLAAENVVKVK